ncbi:MAG: hypothetical protein V7720_05575 [Halioglobus sp.]
MKKLAMVFCLVSAPVFSCNLDDLAGRWNMIFDEFSCELTVASNGKISKGQCIHMPHPNPDAAVTRSAVRGRLKMLANCRVTGKLSTKTRGGDELKVSISQSRLGSDHRYWQGLLYQDPQQVFVDVGPLFGEEPVDVYDGKYSNFSAVAF